MKIGKDSNDKSLTIRFNQYEQCILFRAVIDMKARTIKEARFKADVLEAASYKGSGS